MASDDVTPLDPRALLMTFLDHVPDIAYILDEEGRFVFLNVAAFELLGYTPEELIGQHYSLLIHPDDRDDADRLRSHRKPGAFNERRVQERATRQLDLRLITKGGLVRDYEVSYRHVEVNASGIYDTQRNFMGTYGIARDVTERKLLEAERLKAALATAGAVIHEISQSLQVLINQVSLLLAAIPEDNPHHNSLTVVMRYTMRIAETIEQLRRISRYKTKQYVADVEILDIQSACTEEMPENGQME
jgi:PAS domain S-box-containing protein